MLTIAVIVAATFAAGDPMSSKEAADRIASAGGKLELDGKTVIGVDFSGLATPAGDFAPIAALTDVKRLNLSATALVDQDLRFLQNLPELTELNVAATGLTNKAMEQIVKAKDLRKLNLSHLPIRSDCVGPLLSLKKLESLEIEETHLDSSALSKLLKDRPVEGTESGRLRNRRRCSRRPGRAEGASDARSGLEFHRAAGRRPNCGA